MIRHAIAVTVLLFTGLLASQAATPDRFDQAVAHAGRPPGDLERDAIDHPAEVLRLTDMKPGMVVADVLAGDGYFSELSSYVVGPQGRVLLINNHAFEEWSMPNLGKRLEHARLRNVEQQTRELGELSLAPGSVDVVLLVKVYHDMYWVDATGKWPKVRVGAVLDQLHRALKPGGVLLLVDHSAMSGHGQNDAGTLHRVEEKFALKDFAAHGFRLARKSDVLRRPNDALDAVSYKGAMLGKTDRFVLLFSRG